MKSFIDFAQEAAMDDRKNQLDRKKLEELLSKAGDGADSAMRETHPRGQVGRYFSRTFAQRVFVFSTVQFEVAHLLYLEGINFRSYRGGG